VHQANIQDRDGAPCVLASIRSRYRWLRHIFADGGYAGDKLRKALKCIGEWTIEIVERSDTALGFEVLHADGSSNVLSHGSIDVAGWLRISKRQSPAPVPGHTSPTSEPSPGGSQELNRGRPKLTPRSELKLADSTRRIFCARDYVRSKPMFTLTRPGNRPGG
jgi:hypothetical protein